MDTNEFRRLGHALVDWIAAYRERMGALPVMSQAAPGSVRARFPAAPPAEGGKLAEAVAALDEAVLPGITNWNHPAFFAYFPSNTEPRLGARRSGLRRPRRAGDELADVAGRHRDRGGGDGVAPPDGGAA